LSLANEKRNKKKSMRTRRKKKESRDRNLLKIVHTFSSKTQTIDFGIFSASLSGKPHCK
jgi:hypothetical protein